MTNKVLTPSGDAQLSSDDASLGAYFSLTRGAEKKSVKAAVDEMIIAAGEDQERIVDIFALWMHTRDIRGGKGERALAEEMCFSLMKHFPQSTLKLLSLLPDQYGSWKDVTSILSHVAVAEAQSSEALVRDEAIELYRSRLLADSVDGSSPSLAGKWAPREKNKNTQVAKLLATACFPSSKVPRKEYRAMVSTLNKKLATPEVMMCEHSWKNIDPSRVPSKCLTTKRKAFMNEKVKGIGRRFPEDEDRVKCRENFTSFLEKGKSKTVHGAVSQPHELVKDYINGLLDGVDVEVDLIIEAQWTDLVERLRKDLGEGLGQLVPIADIGSDVGLLPAVIAHAILAAECAPPAFQHRVLTFAEVPQWLNLNTTSDGAAVPQRILLLDRVKVLLAERKSNHMVKDLERAVKMMLGVCTAAKIPSEEVSSLRLLVLSDMSFESTWATRTKAGPWTTQYEALCDEFVQAGYEKVPEVVYWSVASKELAKGESFKLPGLGKNLELELASDSSSILCGACLAYADDQFVDTSCYTKRVACGKSIQHSGDTMVDGKSKHRISIQLEKLPQNIDRLFFSLCACGPADLSHFRRPYINLTDGVSKGNMCRYDLSDAGKAPSNLMAAIVKVPGGGWAITALGDDAKTRCCGNYEEMKGMCSKRLPDTAIAPTERGGDGLTLPVSSETPGVRLLSGFSADMLKCLVVSEEETLAIAAAVEADAAAKAATDLVSKLVTDMEEESEMADSDPKSAAIEEAVMVAEVAVAAAREARVATSAGAKLRRTLRSERYQSVRDVLAKVGEGKLAGYMPPTELIVPR